ncbi:DDE-type integrase/transposase/recombinase, partial [Yersinia aleksiciae]|uniref:DDE-type integrase/transposase/recombinase n=1 Tax=Yersinia aleksiciae TaxID=263819 RepID=UPI0036F331BB
ETNTVDTGRHQIKSRPHAKSVGFLLASPNYLERQFIVPTPNTHWVSDMTYIRTHEGWLYLAVVLDLFSRRVIGWSMGGRMTAELVMDALLMAVWRRKPTAEVLIHSDSNNVVVSFYHHTCCFNR